MIACQHSGCWTGQVRTWEWLGDTVSYTSYVDPIEHAWRHCNPHAPLPPALASRAGQFGFAFRLYSPQNQPVTELSRITEDARHGLLMVAISPWSAP